MKRLNHLLVNLTVFTVISASVLAGCSIMQRSAQPGDAAGVKELRVLLEDTPWHRNIERTI